MPRIVDLDPVGIVAVVIRKPILVGRQEPADHYVRLVVPSGVTYRTALSKSVANIISQKNNSRFCLKIITLSNPAVPDTA
jgi:hypothetical protein